MKVYTRQEFIYVPPFINGVQFLDKALSGATSMFGGIPDDWTEHDYSGPIEDIGLLYVDSNGDLIVDEDYRQAIAYHEALVSAQPEEQVVAYEFQQNNPVYATLPQSAKDEVDALAVAPPVFSYTRE